MRIDLRGEIPPPTWPEGAGVRGFHPSDGPRLHALLEHGYRDGGGSVEAYDVWLPALTGDSEFDPETCFLVEVGDDLAAASICWTSGFVKDIVVHETWRRHGLGESAPPARVPHVPGPRRDGRRAQGAGAERLRRSGSTSGSACARSSASTKGGRVSAVLTRGSARA